VWGYGRVINVQFHPGMVVDLVKGSPSGSVNNAKIGLNPHRSGQRVQKPLKIFQSCTYFQSPEHELSFTVHFPDLVILKVVGCRVHDGKTCLIGSYPGFFTFIGRVCQGQEAILSGIKIGYAVLLLPCIPVFP